MKIGWSSSRPYVNARFTWHLSATFSYDYGVWGRGWGVKKGEGGGGAFLLLSRLIKTSENEF